MGFTDPDDWKLATPSCCVASISVPWLSCKPPKFSAVAPLEASHDCCVFVPSCSRTSGPGVRPPATGTVGGLPPDLAPCEAIVAVEVIDALPSPPTFVFAFGSCCPARRAIFGAEARVALLEAGASAGGAASVDSERVESGAAVLRDSLGGEFSSCCRCCGFVSLPSLLLSTSTSGGGAPHLRFAEPSVIGFHSRCVGVTARGGRAFVANGVLRPRPGATAGVCVIGTGERLPAATGGPRSALAPPPDDDDSRALGCPSGDTSSVIQSSPLPPPPSPSQLLLSSPASLRFPPASVLAAGSGSCAAGVGVSTDFARSAIQLMPLPLWSHFSSAPAFRSLFWLLCFSAPPSDDADDADNGNGPDAVLAAEAW